MDPVIIAVCLIAAGLYVLAVPVVILVMQKLIVRRVEPLKPDDEFLSAWPAALAGFLLFQKGKKQFITATIVSLANRGYLEVVEVGHSLGRTFEFRKTKRSPKGLRRYEHDLITHMFRDDVEQVSDRQLFGKLPSFVSLLYERIAEDIEKRHVFSHTSALREISFPYFASLSAALIIGLLILDIVKDKPVLWIFMVAVAIGILEVGILAHRVPRLTTHGEQVYRRMLSFKKFLDRLDPASPDDELLRYLPYSIAFHEETRKFAVVKKGEAVWYKSESRQEDNLLPLIRAANSMQGQISGEPAIFSYFGWLRSYGSGGYDRP